MNPLALILLIIMGATLWFWGFLEGRDRPTKTAQRKMTEKALEDLRAEADSQVKRIGFNIAESRKEEIYLRYLLCTYIQENILELPDFNGTQDEALKLAIQIARDFYNSHKDNFNNNFKDGIEQASVDILNGKTGLND